MSDSQSSSDDSQSSQSSNHSSDLEDDKSAQHEQLMSLIRSDSSTNEIENALTSNVIDINYQNKNGETFLHVAVRKQKRKTVKLLINNRANVNIYNNSNKKPINLVNKRLKNKSLNKCKTLRRIKGILKNAQPGPSTQMEKKPEIKTKNKPLLPGQTSISNFFNFVDKPNVSASTQQTQNISITPESTSNDQSTRAPNYGSTINLSSDDENRDTLYDSFTVSNNFQNQSTDYEQGMLRLIQLDTGFFEINNVNII